VKWKPIRQGYSDRIDELRRKPPHELLEIREHPTLSQLKHAYRAKVKAYHPDRLDPFLRPHAQEILKIINGAFEVLMRRCRR
jgi:curved DNA-binding protein CbpA